MAAWRDSATVTVYISFADNPLTAAASGTWVDVTTDVRDWSIRRGRTTELSNYSPGTAQVTLDNRARKYDPSNTAGAYYGQLLPMRRIKIVASSGATTATVFTGYVMGWPIEYPGMIDSEVTLQCVDATRILSQYAAPATAYEAKVLADSPLHYWRLDDISNGTSPATVGGVDAINFNQGDPAYNAPADLAITRPVGPSTTVANAGWAATGTSATNPMTVEGWFWNFQYGVVGGNNIARVAASSTSWIRLAIGATDGTVSVGYSNSADVKSYTYAAIGWRVTQSLVHLVLTATTTTLTLYANGQQVWQGSLSAATSTNTFSALPPPSMQAVAQPRSGSPVNPAIYGLAVYGANLTSTKVLDHYIAGLTGWGHPYGDRAGARIDAVLTAIGWPSADRALSTGSTVLGAYTGQGSPLSICQACSDADQGLLFISGDGKVTFRDRQWQWTNADSRTSQATFGDTAGETPYYDIEIDGNHVDWVRNVVTVSYEGASVTVKDASSTAAYGEQDESVSASLIPAGGGFVARQLAAYRLRMRKTPKTRIPSLKVKPRVATSTHLPTLLGLELGERVTVNRRPTGGTGSFSQACTVQGIAHQVTPDNWTTTLYLAPTVASYTEGPYLTLGDATYGKIGTVAGNTIPF